MKIGGQSVKFAFDKISFYGSHEFEVDSSDKIFDYKKILSF